jgi:hypothetical protein
MVVAGPVGTANKDEGGSTEAYKARSDPTARFEYLN